MAEAAELGDLGKAQKTRGGGVTITIMMMIIDHQESKAITTMQVK